MHDHVGLALEHHLVHRGDEGAAFAAQGAQAALQVQVGVRLAGYHFETVLGELRLQRLDNGLGLPHRHQAGAGADLVGLGHLDS